MITTAYTERTHYQKGGTITPAPVGGTVGASLILPPLLTKIVQFNSDQDLAVDVDYGNNNLTPEASSWYLKSGLSELMISEENKARIFVMSRVTNTTNVTFAFAQ